MKNMNICKLDAWINMLMINCISCNYLIKQSNNKKKPPIARGIHIQNISMTKGKKCEKQEKDKKVKKKKRKTRQNKKQKKKLTQLEQIWRTRITCFKDNHILGQNVCPYLHFQHEQIISLPFHKDRHNYCLSMIASSYDSSSYTHTIMFWLLPFYLLT